MAIFIHNLKHMETIRSDRFLSLDVLRGIAVACMILVNNQYTGAAFMQLRQGTWNDITFTDMVFPFFIFIVGASFWFFSNKEEGVSGISMIKKVFFRGIKLFVAGLLLNWCLFGLDLEHLRIFGVLQRIAVVYVLGAFVILGLKKDWKIVMAVVFILFSYWGILAFTGGYASIENYIGTKIDRPPCYLFVWQYKIAARLHSAKDRCHGIRSAGRRVEILYLYVFSALFNGGIGK